MFSGQSENYLKQQFALCVKPMIPLKNRNMFLKETELQLLDEVISHCQKRRAEIALEDSKAGKP